MIWFISAQSGTFLSWLYKEYSLSKFQLLLFLLQRVDLHIQFVDGFAKAFDLVLKSKLQFLGIIWL